jgi:hypothetical protein
MRLCTAATAANTSSGESWRSRAAPLELVGEDVDQHLGVAAGVDVASVDVEQLLLERRRIGQVAVVDEDDARTAR